MAHLPNTMTVERITYPTEWYDKLVQDCQVLIEGMHYSIVETKFRIGKRILEDEQLVFGGSGGRGNETTRKIARDLKMPTRELRRCIQFAKKFEVWNDVLKAVTSDRLSWHKVVHEVLVERPRPRDEFYWELYNVWRTFEIDDEHGDVYPGMLPHRLIQNIVYHWSNKGDLVVDPMAGGGVTIDVCKELERRCHAYDIKPKRDGIVQNDVLNGIPDKNVDLIILDPPYYNLLEEKYIKNKFTKDLESFYEAMENTFENCYEALKAGGYLTLIMMPQYPEKKYGDWEDTTFKLVNIANKFLKEVMRVVAPLSTQQYGGWDVNYIKENKHLLLPRLRDIIIFQKND